MKRKYLPADLSRARTIPFETRPTKVDAAAFAGDCPPDATLSQFLDTLPHLLKADDLRAIVDAIANAHRRDKPVVAGIGGHVVKCGLGPLLVRMMEEGLISAVAMNGGASIHDFEIGLSGRTSEDVAASLATGMFGMVRETAEHMNSAIAAAALSGTGMGAALGGKLLELQPPYLGSSVLAAGARLGLPVTVHITVGGDTIHMHPDANGAALGSTSLVDFRLLVSVLRDLDGGGVYLNIGSAVVLPEVFLKALNLARNLHEREIVDFTTVNLDMLQHYRPSENVVKRPTAPGGKGYALTGHHEIMVPLLFQLVRAKIHAERSGQA